MAKVVQLGADRGHEAVLVAGMLSGDKMAQYELYNYCADYYYAKYRSLFTAPDEVVDEIFQNSFIKLWEHIESRRIYSEDGVVKGRNSEPLTGSIRSYFMSITHYKFQEWCRENPKYANPETEFGRKIRSEGFDEGEYLNMVYGTSNNIQLEIIADLIASMPERCYEILTKFYYEEKDLDSILKELPSIESKNALKTKKHKCMENLREVAKETYERFLKHN